MRAWADESKVTAQLRVVMCYSFPMLAAENDSEEGKAAPSDVLVPARSPPTNQIRDLSRADDDRMLLLLR